MSKKHDGIRKESIPTLRCGKGNKFYAFQQALSRKALMEYGDLGKLIADGKYYILMLVIPDFSKQGLLPEEVASMQLEMLKNHARRLERIKPRLYGLILEHMSVESKDEVAQDEGYQDWSKSTDPEKLWQAIIKTHKVDCVSNVTQVKQFAARKAYKSMKQGTYKSLVHYRERFREMYCVKFDCREFYQYCRRGSSNGFLPWFRSGKVWNVQDKHVKWVVDRSD